MASRLAVPRVLIGAAAAIFLLGAMLSARPYYAGQPFNLKQAMISSLASPADNPHGYLWMDVAIGLAALALVPVVMLLFITLRPAAPITTIAGSLLIFGGLISAMRFALQSSRGNGFVDSDIHLWLAYAAFTLTAAGTFALLTIPALRARSKHLRAFTVLHACVVVFLIYLIFGEFHGGYFFNDSSLLHSIALCEWMLCAESAAALYLLASVDA